MRFRKERCPGCGHKKDLHEIGHEQEFDCTYPGCRCYGGVTITSWEFYYIRTKTPDGWVYISDPKEGIRELYKKEGQG